MPIQNIPLTFRLSPLPAQNFTPQQFADALVARLTAESTNTISFFAAGSVAPTSNVGPFLKDNTTWYVWSDPLGQYVPQTLDPESKGYIDQQSPGPDHTVYIFWIELDGAGKAQSIQYYSGGAWKDVYEDKFALYPTTVDMNTAIAAAVGSANSYPAAANEGGLMQIVPVDGAGHKMNLTNAYINGDGKYNTGISRYTAPINGVYRVSLFSKVSNSTGNAAGMEVKVAVYKNGILSVEQGTSVASPPNSRWWPGFSSLVQLNATDSIEAYMTASDGVGTGNVHADATTFTIELIKAT